MDKFKKALKRKEKSKKNAPPKYNVQFEKHFSQNVERLRNALLKKYNLKKHFEELHQSILDNCNTPILNKPKIIINDENSSYISDLEDRIGEYEDILRTLKRYEGIHMCLAQFCCVESEKVIWPTPLVLIVRIGVEIKDYSELFFDIEKFDEKKILKIMSSKIIWKLLINKVHEGISIGESLDDNENFKIFQNKSFENILNKTYDFFTKYEKGGKFALYNKIFKISLADSLRASGTILTPSGDDLIIEKKSKKLE